MPIKIKDETLIQYEDGKEQKQQSSLDEMMARRYLRKNALASDTESLNKALETLNNGWQDSATVKQTQKQYDEYMSNLSNVRDYVGGIKGHDAELEDYYQQISKMYFAYNDLDIGGYADTYGKYDSKDAYDQAIADAQKAQEEYNALLNEDVGKLSSRIEQLDREIAAAENEMNANYPNGTAMAVDRMDYDLPTLEAQRAELMQRRSLAERTQKLASYESISSDANYADYIYAGRTVENPSWEDADDNIIPNKVKFIKDNYAKMFQGYASTGAMNSVRGLGDFADAWWATYIHDNMEQNEINVYNAILSRDGVEAADTYLKSLEERFAYRYGKKVADNTPDSDTLRTVFGLVAGLDQFGNSIENLFDTESDYFAPSGIATANQYMQEENGKFGKWLNDALVSVGNMLPSLAVGSILPGISGVAAESAAAKAFGFASSALFTAGAMGSSYTEYINSGMSKDEARLISTVQGLWEGLSEYYLGSIEGFGDNFIVKSLEKASSRLGKAMYAFATNGVFKYVWNGLQEGAEEIIQGIGSNIIDGLATGKWEWDSFEDRAYEGFLGFLTSAILGVPSAIVGTSANLINTRNIGKTAKANGNIGDITSLIKDTFSADSVAYKIANEVDDNTGAYKIGKMIREANATLSEQNKQDLVSYMTERGVRENDAKNIADWLVLTINEDYELNEQQIAILEANDVVADAMREKILGMTNGVSPYGTQTQTYGGSSVISRVNAVNEINDLALGVAQKQTESATKAPSLVETYNAQNLAKAMAEEMRGIDTEFKNTPTVTTFSENAEAARQADIANNEIVTSDNGKTIYTDKNGNASEVDIDSIIKAGADMQVKLNDGREVSVKDVSFPNVNQTILYRALSNEDISASAADQIAKGYRDSMGSPIAYVKGMVEGITYGKYNQAESAVSNDSFYAELSEEDKRIARNIGKIESVSETGNKQSKVNAKQNGKAAAKQGRLINEVSDSAMKSLSSRQKVSVEGLKTVAKNLGVDIYLYNSAENGEKVNGWFDTKDNSIHIDIRAGQTYNGVIMFTLGHELTHFIAKWSPSKFKTFADFLINEYGKNVNNGTSIDELIFAQKQKAAKQGRRLSTEAAYEELVADACERMLLDESAWEAMAKLKETDKSLWQKVKDFISSFVARLNKAYKGISPDSNEAIAVRDEMQSVAEKLQSLWNEALTEAGQAYQNAAEAELYDAAGLAFDPSLDTVYSTRFSTGDENLSSVNRMKLIDNIAKKTGRTIKEAERFVRAEEAAAMSVKGTFLDFEGNEKEVAIKSNSDYPQGTIDLTNICPKRIAVTRLTNRLQEALPNDLFTADDYADIRLILMNDGRVVACGLCFVEDRRQYIGEIAQDFIKEWNSAIKNGKNLTRLNSKKERSTVSIGKDVAERYGVKNGTITPTKVKLTQETFMSSTKWHELQRSNPYVAAAFEAFNNARGQSAGRLLLDRAEYKREILKWNKTKVNSVNKVGGLRIFSFSDFEVYHLVDLLQIIEDCAAKGVMIQGYTKQTKFARLVSQTGIKLNRSFIPYGATGIKIVNGKKVVAIDTVEGINNNDPNFLDETDNPNVGNNITGINDEQIHLAMQDKFFHYIIPFHTNKSSDSNNKLGVGKWRNYKPYQTDKTASSAEDIRTVAKLKRQYMANGMSDTDAYDAAVKYASKQGIKFEALKESQMINIYTEVIPDPSVVDKKSFVDKFLEVCKDKNIVPRYPQFLNVNENGDFEYAEGYEKFLVDFKLFDDNGNILPQGLVTPTFDNEFIQSIIADEAKKTERERSGDVYPESLYADILNYIKVKHGYNGDTALYDKYNDIVNEEVAKSNSDDNGTGNVALSPSASRKLSTRVTAEEDAEYMDAYYDDDYELMQKLVEKAARANGYDSPMLYHGTKQFGFTRIKTSGVEKDVSWSPFFAASSEDISSSYVPLGKVRDVSADIEESDVEEAIDERKESIKDLIDDFRRYIDRYFSEWVFGMTDNSYLEDLVRKANPDPGNGDGVYDVLDDIVVEGFYDYQDQFEDYEDLEDWQENSDEAKKLYEIIVEIEAEKSSLSELESGNYSGGIYRLYANTNNLFVVDAKGKAWNELRPEGLPPLERYGHKDVPYRTRDVALWARDNGYDGVLFKNIYDNGAYGRTPYGDVYCFFNPESQVKSADPVTYDDDGDPIPLSERFNEKNEDIRYSTRFDRNIGDGYDALTESEKAAFRVNEANTKVGSPLMTLRGFSNPNKPRYDVGRYNNNVGKMVSGQLYLHKNYVGEYKAVESAVNKAKKVLDNSQYKGFEYNTIMYQKSKGIETVRFDSAENFDTASEPWAGDYVSIDLSTGVARKGHTEAIWHHKWMWVKNDYKGFDVAESWNWSKVYSSALRELAPSTNVYSNNFSYRGIPNGQGYGSKFFDEQLKRFNLIKPTNGDGVRYSNRDNVSQEISSADTSIKQVPALFNNPNVKFGKTNVDIGGGKYDLATEQLAANGTKNYIFDPFNRGEEENTNTLNFIKKSGGADTATCANVLNVIAEQGARDNVILEAAKAIKPDGVAYFMVYEGDGKGIGKKTSKGWQNNRKTSTYVSEIKQYFNDVIPKGKLIVAKEPKANLDEAYWQVSENNTIRYSERITDDEYAELKKHFGTTNDIRVAGYLLKDGKMLDFSGKHWGDTTSRVRQVDHRDVNEVISDDGVDGTPYGAMVKMIADGNIRLMPEDGGINLSAPPTDKQRLVLRHYISMFSQYYKDSDGVTVDYDAPGGDTVYSKTYSKGTDTRTILRDIDNYFKVGKQNMSSIIAEFHNAYSLRDPEASNRELLANALESTVTNETDAKYLADYKANIEKLNAEEAKLKDLKAQIKELSFAKGKRDTAKIIALQGEATKTQNRIGIYDKKLLKLEASAPLQKVLDAEKDKLRKKLTAEYKASLAEQRDKAKQREADIRATYQESRKNATQRRNATVIRNKIKAIANDLQQRLTNSTETRFVPEPLVNGVVEVYNLIDQTGRDPESKASESKVAMRDALNNLKTKYDTLKNNKEYGYDFSSEFSEEFSSLIGELAEAVDGTPVRDMTLDQLQDVHDIISDIAFMVKTASKQILENESISNYDAGQEVIAKMKEISGKKLNKGQIEKFFREWTLNPMRAVLEMNAFDENAYLYKLFAALDEGRRKADTFKMTETKKIDALRESKEDLKQFNDAVETPIDFGLTDINGKPYEMTKMQAMQLVLTWDREQKNPKHIHLSQTGAIIPDAKLQAKGKFDEALDNGVRIGAVTFNDVSQIMSKFNEWDNRFLAIAREIFNKDSSAAINEVTMQTKRRPIATENAYIPYEIDKDYVASESENLKFNATIENMGMLKSVVPNASQPLIMRGLNAILDKHINDVAKVSGLTIPVRNFNKVFNMKQTLGDGGDTVKASISRTWGKGGEKLVDRAVADLQSSRPHDNIPLLNSIKSGFVVSTLANNISVWMKQAASYPTAGAILSNKALIKGLWDYTVKIKDGIHAQDVWDEIDAHTSQHWIRRQGLSSQELGEMNQSKGWANRLNRRLGKASPMNWIQAMDVGTTAALWYACKAEVEAKGITENDANYWDEVTSLYDKVIEETQPMYDSLHRAEITKNTAAKNIIMFQTQPIQNSGILRESGERLKMARKQYGRNSAQTKAAARQFRMAVTSQVASHFVFTLMTLIGRALLHKMDDYRDEDENVTFESVMAEFGKQFGTNYFGAIVPVFGNYATEFAEKIVERNRFDVFSDPTVDTINGVLDTFSTLTNPSWDDFRKMSLKLAGIFGIPAENAYNIVNGAYANIQDIINGDFGKFEYGVERTIKQNLHNAYAAYKSGDNTEYKQIIQDMLDHYISNGKTEKEAKSSVRSSLTSNYKSAYVDAFKSGDLTKANEIRKFLYYTGCYGSLTELDDTLKKWRTEK